MMTSLADVMQTGVVIGQAAENVYSFACACVCTSGQGESMQCPLGVFCSQSDGHAFALIEEKS